MQIALTGSTGFVARNLIPYLLSRGIQCTPLGRNDLAAAGGLTFEGQNAVVHLAGKAHDVSGNANAEEYYSVNYELTKRVYDAFIRSSAAKFVYLSSVKAASDAPDGPLTEDVIPDPKTHYGRSKLKAEEYISNQPPSDGRSYYILRPCMIHGPGNVGNLNLLVRYVRKGYPLPLGSFDNRRSFLSVENLCFVINELLTRDDIPSGTYNLADDQTISTSGLVKLIAGQLRVKDRLWSLPPTLVIAAARAGDILGLPLNSERLRKLTEDYVVSNRKIKAVMGKELPVTLTDGLAETIRSFVES